MAIPPRLRYWWVRVQALNRPLLWSTSLAVVLLVVVLRQYQVHPEWLGQFEVDEGDPSQDLPGSTLSPEEQAGVADIDNLSALYSSLNGSPATPEQPSTSGGVSATRPATDLLSILQASNSPAAASAAAPGDAAKPPASPFASYLDQYQFLGQRNPAPALGSPLNAAQTPQPSLLLSSDPSGITPSPLVNQPVVNPLQQALQQQLERRETGTANAQAAAPTPGGSLGAGAATDAVSGISPATLPGTNQTFLRTTPQMSPPPGTTGYVPPATLAAPAGGTPYSSYPVLPGVAAVVPNLSPASPSQSLNLAPPGVGGTVLPPTGGSQYDSSAVTPQAAPFTVPRPPGSHTGGGYIYTFSDPNGPAQ